MRTIAFRSHLEVALYREFLVAKAQEAELRRACELICGWQRTADSRLENDAAIFVHDITAVLSGETHAVERIYGTTREEV